MVYSVKDEEAVMEKAIATLMDALDEVVRAAGTWQEKKNKILEIASEDEKTALYEFVAWFD